MKGKLESYAMGSNSHGLAEGSCSFADAGKNGSLAHLALCAPLWVGRSCLKIAHRGGERDRHFDRGKLSYACPAALFSLLIVHPPIPSRRFFDSAPLRRVHSLPDPTCGIRPFNH